MVYWSKRIRVRICEFGHQQKLEKKTVIDARSSDQARAWPYVSSNARVLLARISCERLKLSVMIIKSKYYACVCFVFISKEMQKKQLWCLYTIATAQEYIAIYIPEKIIYSFSKKSCQRNEKKKKKIKFNSSMGHLLLVPVVSVAVLLLLRAALQTNLYIYEFSRERQDKTRLFFS